MPKVFVKIRLSAIALATADGKKIHVKTQLPNCLVLNLCAPKPSISAPKVRAFAQNC